MAPRSGSPERSPRHGGAALGAAHRVSGRFRPRRGHRAIGFGRGVRACAGHPALLAYAVGNEIPASIVRWHGPRRVERFIERLANAARTEDPGCLVTYVNYPSTEYLDPAGLDFLCFNVYLEEPRSAWTRIWHACRTVAGDRPLLMGEIGFDSRRHGRGRARRRCSTGRCGRPLPPAARARSSSRGRTSGTAAGTTSTTGTSA